MFRCTVVVSAFACGFACLRRMWAPVLGGSSVIGNSGSQLGLFPALPSNIDRVACFDRELVIGGWQSSHGDLIRRVGSLCALSAPRTALFVILVSVFRVVHSLSGGDSIPNN